jgi:hypothetical protein
MTDKNIEPIEAVAKIKLLINNYFEEVGRGEDADVLRLELIDDIEEISDRVNIPTKIMILQKFEMEKEDEPRG